MRVLPRVFNRQIVDMAFVSLSPLGFRSTLQTLHNDVCIKTKSVVRRATWKGCAIISRDEVVKTAKLAQLELKDDEVERATEEFRKIIDFFNTMSRLDLENVEPMARPSDRTNVLRSDEPKGFSDMYARVSFSFRPSQFHCNRLVGIVP